MSKKHNEIDIKVLKGCVKQNRKSQEALYKHYYAYAMSICLRYAENRDEASEIMNDAFLKVFQNIKIYDSSKPFTAWLRKITINTAIDYYRRNINYTKHISNVYSEGFVNAESVDSLEIEDILLILKAIPKQQRLIFNLYEIEGYSHKEIAKKLNISEKTSSSYLSIAKKNIREEYKKASYKDSEIIGARKSKSRVYSCK